MSTRFGNASAKRAQLGERNAGLRARDIIEVGALREAGVDALADFAPFVVVDDLGRNDDALSVVVEGDVGELARSDAPMHGADRARRLAAAGGQRLGRPLLEIGLARGVVVDLARPVGRLRRRDAGDEPLVEIDLEQRQEEFERTNEAPV